MKSSLLNVLTICGAVCLMASSAGATRFHIKEAGNGITAVTDMDEGLTYYVRDADAFIKGKYIMSGRVSGFGGSLSQKEFAKGTPITQPVTNAVDKTVRTGKRIIPRPIRKPLSRLFGTPTYQRR